MANNRLQPLVLSDAERQMLQGWATRRKTAQGLALRARIVLACAEGRSNTAVAARLGISRTTVIKWRDRFLAARLDGLADEPRPGVPRTITDARVEEVVVRTLEEIPEGATHWSKRELAKRVGISPTSVHRIWRAFGLQPWRVEDFKISPDPLLIDKIRDVIGLYLAPPANAAVFAVDEKPRRPGHADWRHWPAGSFTAQTAGVSGVATFLGFGVPLAATASRLPCEQRIAIGFAGPRAAPVRRGHRACEEGRRRPGHAISRGAGER
jgi:transposase